MPRVRATVGACSHSSCLQRGPRSINDCSFYFTTATCIDDSELWEYSQLFWILYPRFSNFKISKMIEPLLLDGDRWLGLTIQKSAGNLLHFEIWVPINFQGWPSRWFGQWRWLWYQNSERGPSCHLGDKFSGWLIIGGKKNKNNNNRWDKCFLQNSKLG